MSKGITTTSLSTSSSSSSSSSSLSLINANASGNDSNISTHGHNARYWYSLADAQRLGIAIRQEFLGNRYAAQVIDGNEQAATRENTAGVFMADPYYHSSNLDILSTYLNDDIDHITASGIFSGKSTVKKWDKLPDKLILPVLSGAHMRIVAVEINYGKEKDQKLTEQPQISICINDPYGNRNVSTQLREEISKSVVSAANKLIQAEYEGTEVQVENIEHSSKQVIQVYKDLDQQGLGENSYDCFPISYSNAAAYMRAAVATSASNGMTTDDQTKNASFLEPDFRVPAATAQEHKQVIKDIRAADKSIYASITGTPIIDTNSSRSDETLKAMEKDTKHVKKALSLVQSSTSETGSKVTEQDIHAHRIEQLSDEDIMYLFTILENNKAVKQIAGSSSKDEAGTTSYTQEDIAAALVELGRSKYNVSSSGAHNNAASYLQVGNFLLKTGCSSFASNEQEAINSLNESINAFNKGINLEPNLPELYLSQAIALSILNREEEAKQCCDKVIELNKNNITAYLLKATILAKFSKAVDAIECCNEVIKIDPKSEEAHLIKGRIFSNGEYKQKAIECYDEAIKINPKSVDAHYSKGLLLQYCASTVDDLKKAQESFMKVHSILLHDISADKKYKPKELDIITEAINSGSPVSYESVVSTISALWHKIKDVELASSEQETANLHTTNADDHKVSSLMGDELVDTSGS